MSGNLILAPQIAMTGLLAASPIGFMAAIGLLRVCAQDHHKDVRLSWNQSHAVLHGLDKEALVNLLQEHMKCRASAPEFNFKVTNAKLEAQLVGHLREIRPNDYRNAAVSFAGNARALGFLAAYGTDAVINDKGYVARTQLDFTSGNQQFVKSARELAAELDPEAKRPKVALTTRIERALFGGPYEDQHTFGWDPASLMTHAHQPMAPTDGDTPGQPMAVWLALEALPLHPVLPARAQRAVTCGVRARTYIWPQWSPALQLAEVALLRQRPVQTLGQLDGVNALWASTFTSVGKYTFLLPGARTKSVRTVPGGFARDEEYGESTT